VLCWWLVVCLIASLLSLYILNLISIGNQRVRKSGNVCKHLKFIRKNYQLYCAYHTILILFQSFYFSMFFSLFIVNLLRRYQSAIDVVCYWVVSFEIFIADINIFIWYLRFTNNSNFTVTFINTFNEGSTEAGFLVFWLWQNRNKLGSQPNRPN